MSLRIFDNCCTGARSGRFVRRQVCVAEEDVALLRPNHRQWQRVHDVKQNCTGVHSGNFYLKSSWVESNPGDKIENQAKDGLFEIGFCY